MSKKRGGKEMFVPLRVFLKHIKFYLFDRLFPADDNKDGLNELPAIQSASIERKRNGVAWKGKATAYVYNIPQLCKGLTQQHNSKKGIKLRDAHTYLNSCRFNS